MKAPDVGSTMVAGLFGAFIFVALWYFFKNKASGAYIPLLGFTTGALVQVGVRTVGVS